MFRKVHALALAFVVLACGGTAPPAQNATGASSPSSSSAPAPADAAYRAEADRLYDAYFERIPVAGFGGSQGVALGMHKFDGKLPDDSPAGLKERITFLHDARARLEKFPAAQLSDDARFERDVFVMKLRSALFALEVRRTPWREPLYYVGALGLMTYTSRDYAPVDERARAIVTLCHGAHAYLEQARANLEPSLPRPSLGMAMQVIGGQITFNQKDAVEALAGITDPQLKADVEKGLAELSTELGAFRDELKSRMPKGTDDFALGEAGFLQMLEETEGIKTDLATLERAGRADLERNLKAIEAAAKELAPDKSTHDAIELARADHLAPDQAIAVGREQVTMLRKFLETHPIVTLPSNEQAEVRESPPFMRANFASINQPGPFEKRALPSFYFISPPDPKWPEAEQRAYVPSREVLLFTTVHEVWPGHFLDRLHRERLQSRILKSFGSYAANEGWAHYTEEMMWDAGVAGKDPRAHIAQLLQALMRDARFLSAIGLHAKGMTVAESHKLFVEQAFQDEGTAKQQSMRGTIDPMYLNYTLGKLMIRKLRADWQAKKGVAFNEKDFHDRFLTYGDAPLPLTRRAMLGDDAGPAL
jgi:uncharacterized protein (DUF885 family)